ncbi:hypothetical protein L0F63_005236 [Massospora cicadina]|nr:hypothetical protein L0F63_005236 [Massospora cicadina]
MRALECNRDLLNPTFEGYKLQPLDTEASASKKQFGVEVKAPITTLPQPDLPYTWLQTSDDVTVYFTLKHAIEVKALKCVLKDDTFFLEEASSMLEPLERGWFGRIQSKESAWTIENGRWLTLHLEKADKGTRWSSLFDFEDGVLEALDPNELAEIRENLEKYTGNPRPRYALQQPFGSEIEQVDFEGEDVYLTIHDLEGHRQQTFTSSGMSWLGVSLVESNFSAPRFILRYDVDALVFDADPPFRHSSTFDAMGYVQASKRNCKMLVLSSDLNLMMIVECHSNIYLYGKSSPSFRRWAPQAVIQVPSDSPIQGVQLMYNKYLLVLTQCEAFLLDLGGFIRA